MGGERTPTDLREGVRTGIVEALDRDAALRGGRTARLLVAAGALGVFGALGMIRMLSGHPYGHHPSWHVVVFSAVWSGLLVVALAIAFLQLRTPSMPLARSARVALLGLGVAGICSALCPDPHFLDWWNGTMAGGALAAIGGVPLSAFCFGAMTALLFGGVAMLLTTARGARAPIGPLLPASMLLLLLAPGIALQSFGTSWAVCVGWFVGTAAGAYGGVALATRA